MKKAGRGAKDVFEDCSVLILFKNKNKRDFLQSYFHAQNTPENVEYFLNKFAKLSGTAGEWRLLSQKLSNETLRQVAIKVSNELISSQSTVAVDVEVSKEIKSQLNIATKKNFLNYFMQFFFRKKQA